MIRKFFFSLIFFLILVLLAYPTMAPASSLPKQQEQVIVIVTAKDPKVVMTTVGKNGEIIVPQSSGGIASSTPATFRLSQAAASNSQTSSAGADDGKDSDRSKDISSSSSPSTTVGIISEPVSNGVGKDQAAGIPFSSVASNNAGLLGGGVFFGSASNYSSSPAPPLANAGQNQTVHPGEIVTLDGSASADPSGFTPLSYDWSFKSKPTGSNANLSGANTVNPSFTPDVLGDYVVQLVVTNSQGIHSAPATVTISTTNSAPVANAGPDQSLTVIGTTVYLDGRESYDVDGDPITYHWSLTSKPVGSTAALSGANTETPTFVADIPGTYIIQLVVHDPWADSSPDTVTVSFSSIKPIANPESSQSSMVGDTVTLSGSGSTDANGDSLTYKRSFTTLPTGSTATIASPTAKTTTFVPDLPGTYVVQLIVNDGYVDSDPSTIQVQVVSKQDATIMRLQELVTLIGSLDASVFKNTKQKNMLINNVNAVIGMEEIGTSRDYQNALVLLENKILPTTDGCALEGKPDKNDWIIDWAAQGLVYYDLLDIIAMVKRLL
jgi:hypothetical protein